MRICLLTIALLVGVGACGDDLAPTGPRPLVADPAVEAGCSQPITDNRARVKVVECAGELAPGRPRGRSLLRSSLPADSGHRDH